MGIISNKNQFCHLVDVNLSSSPCMTSATRGTRAGALKEMRRTLFCATFLLPNLLGFALKTVPRPCQSCLELSSYRSFCSTMPKTLKRYSKRFSLPIRRPKTSTWVSQEFIPVEIVGIGQLQVKTRKSALRFRFIKTKFSLAEVSHPAMGSCRPPGQCSHPRKQLKPQGQCSLLLR